MKLIVIGLLILPLLAMIVLIYLSKPESRLLWVGCALIVCSLVILLGAGLSHYDQYYRPKVGVLGNRIPRTFWDAQLGLILISGYAFLKGLFFILFGRNNNYRIKWK